MDQVNYFKKTIKMEIEHILLALQDEELEILAEQHYKEECYKEYPVVERSKMQFKLKTLEGSSSVLPTIQSDVTLINAKGYLGRQVFRI